MSFLSYPTTNDQKELLQTTDKLAKIFAKRAANYDWEGTFPLENFKDLHKAGYLSLTIPKDLGGKGASLLDVTMAQFHLAQGDGSTGLVTSMHLIHLGKLVEGRASYPPLVEKICRDVVEQGAMLNSAVSEPATGSPSRGGRPTTTARRQPDGSWYIDGRKTFTTGSYALHYFIVGCSIEDEAGEQSHLPPLTATRGNFLVHYKTPGLRIEDTWDTLGMRGTGSNDLVLEHVHLEPEAYVDESIPPVPDQHKYQGAWTLPVAAVYLGIAQAAREEAIRFAQKRKPNSLQQPISSIPHIQEKVAKMDLALIQARAVLFGLAEQYSQDPKSVHSSLFGAAKYIATNQAIEVVDLAMRVVGAASLSLKSPLQRYYRDVRAGLHNPPMDDATIAQLAKSAFEVQD